MKETWVQPRIMVEGFYPNEYCTSVCWKLACIVMGDNPSASDPYPTYQTNYDEFGHAHRVENNTHSKGACGNANNQYVQVDDNGVITVKEKSADQGWLVCTPTNKDWNPLTSFNGINTGDTVYWTTTDASGSRTWHHHGTASEGIEGCPLRMS